MPSFRFIRAVTAGLAFMLAGMLATGSVGAVPILKARIEVDASVVTAGDMFTNAGDLAAEPLFLSPAPGTTGEVMLADVKRAMAKLGLKSFDAAGLASIFVARRGLVVDMAFLNTLIASEMRTRELIGLDQAIELTLNGQLPALVADTSALQPVRLEGFQYAPGNARFVARLIVAGRRTPVRLTGRVDRLVEVPVLTRSLVNGDLISARDYRFSTVPARLSAGGSPLTEADLLGMTVRRSMGPGTVLRAIDVELPRLVVRNQAVTLYYQSGPLFLTVKGRALADATLNEPVNVLSLGSKKIIRGIAVSPGSVLVSTGPMQISALN